MRRHLLTFLFALSLMAVLPQRMSAAANIEIIDNDFQQITVTVTSAGVLHVTGANGLVLQVYNVLGVRVASIKVEGNDKRIDLPLKSGCYIVKVGNVVRKISIIRRLARLSAVIEYFNLSMSCWFFSCIRKTPSS